MKDIQDPPLEVRDHHVHQWQYLAGHLRASLNGGDMIVARGRKEAVRPPTVRGDLATRRDRGAGGRTQRAGRRIRDDRHRDFAKPTAFRSLRHDGHRCALPRVPGGTTSAFAANVRLVHLHLAAEPLVSHHGVYDLAPHRPGSLGRDAKLPRELGCGQRLGRRGEQVDGGEPLEQRGSRLMKDRASRDGGLVPAGRTLVGGAVRDRIGAITVAARAGEAIRPAVTEQGVSAVLLRAERREQLDEGPWCLGHVAPILPRRTFIEVSIGVGSDIPELIG